MIIKENTPFNEKGLADRVLFAINSNNLERAEEHYAVYIKFTEILGKAKDIDLLIRVNNRYIKYQVEEAKRKIKNEN